MTRNNQFFALLISGTIFSYTNAMMPTSPIVLEPEIKLRAEKSLHQSSGRLINVSNMRLAKGQLAALIIALPESVRLGVEALNLASCELYTLPLELALLRNLRSLNLINNALYELPETFGAWFPRLEVLNLSFNEITSIPDSVGTLTLLRKLYLEVNRLEHLPDSISDIMTLELITLEENLLIHTPLALMERQAAGKLIIRE